MGLWNSFGLSLPRSVFRISTAGILLLASSVAWSANWTVVERPGDMGKKGEAGALSSINGCYRIVLELQGASLADGVGFTMNTALVSPHKNNCTTWIDTGAGELFNVTGNRLVIEAYAATSVNDTNVKRITVQGAHGVDSIELLFGPNEQAVSGSSTPPPSNPPPPLSGSATWVFDQTICQVQVNAEDNSAAIRPCANWTNKGCATAGSYLLWTLNNNSPGSLALHSAAVSAMLTGTPVAFSYSDVCQGPFNRVVDFKLSTDPALL